MKEDINMTYKELYDRKKLIYASELESALADGDLKRAYKILGKLMRYRMIVPDDKLLSKENLKKFVKAGIPDKHRFEKDYRKDKDYLPDNIFYNIPTYMKISVLSEKHWGKRVELVYEGDIIIPEKLYHYDIRLKDTSGTAKAALREMKEMYKRESGLDLSNNWEEALETGNSKIYEIVLSNGQQFVLRNLGYIYVTLSRKKVVVAVLLDNSNLIKHFINIKKAYEVVIDTVVDHLAESGISVEIINVKPMCDIKMASEYQAKKYKNLPPLDYDAFCEQENKKLELAATKEQE